MEWEEIDLYTDRAKILGGWIVRYIITSNFWNSGGENCVQAPSITFVPDPEHKWEIKK
jgi:hypothetical protein